MSEINRRNMTGPYITVDRVCLTQFEWCQPEDMIRPRFFIPEIDVDMEGGNSFADLTGWTSRCLQNTADDLYLGRQLVGQLVVILMSRGCLFDMRRVQIQTVWSDEFGASAGLTQSEWSDPEEGASSARLEINLNQDIMDIIATVIHEWGHLLHLAESTNEQAKRDGDGHTPLWVFFCMEALMIYNNSPTSPILRDSVDPIILSIHDMCNYISQW